MHRSLHSSLPFLIKRTPPGLFKINHFLSLTHLKFRFWFPKITSVFRKIMPSHGARPQDPRHRNLDTFVSAKTHSRDDKGMDDFLIILLGCTWGMNVLMVLFVRNAYVADAERTNSEADGCSSALPCAASSFLVSYDACHSAVKETWRITYPRGCLALCSLICPVVLSSGFTLESSWRTFKLLKTPGS